MKQIIDKDKWIGKKHYEWFIKYPIHYYNITKQVDVTKLINYVSDKCIDGNKVSIYIVFLYLITKSLNSIEEMRLRIENGDVVLYDVIDPAYLVMTNDKVYDNCESTYFEDFKVFYYNTKKDIDIAKEHVIINKSYNDLSNFGQYYMSCLPWIDFSGFIHPMPADESAYVPRICWSKYSKEDNKYTMALNIQVSHALVDGYPLAKAFLEVEKNFNNPEQLDL